MTINVFQAALLGLCACLSSMPCKKVVSKS